MGRGVGATRAALLRLAPSLLALACSAAIAQSHNEVLLNAGTLVTDSPDLEAARQVPLSFTGKRLHLVQFEGSILPGDVEGLKAQGLTVVTYIPMNAYLVWGDAASLSRLRAAARAEDSRIAWDGPWLDEYKFAPSVWAGEAELKQPMAQRRVSGDQFEVQLVADAGPNRETLARLIELGGSVKSDPGALAGYENRVLVIPPAALVEFARRPDIVSIHRYIEPRQFDEAQARIVGGAVNETAPLPGNYLNDLASWGFTQAQFNASGFIVDVTDDGADRNPGPTDPGTCTTDANVGTPASPLPVRHFALREGGTVGGASRFIYKGRWGSASTADACLGLGGHGQLNMSIVGGFVPDTIDPAGTRVHRDAQGFRYGLGIAPFVRLANSVIFDPDFTSPNIPNMLFGGYGSGARISSNSWGAPVGGAYNANAQTYDGLVRDAQAGLGGNQPMIVLVAAGNSGPGANTTGSPATAKNVITVGASENVRSHAEAAGGNTGNTTGADGCAVPDSGADNRNDIIGFSSRGPTDDGRFKPDLVAPGTHVTGIAYVAAGQNPTQAPNWFLGTADPGFRADGVCAMPGGGVAGNANNFFPVVPAQRWYTTSSGTSHSTPAVAGAAALVYQQFINNPTYIATHRTPAGSAPPSPAMTKAFLMNTAGYLNGVGANDTLPSNRQGMGAVNLAGAFSPTAPRILRDQVALDRFSSTGELRTFVINAPSGFNPLRVTLAWTDAPGPTAGDAFVNNLDLTVYANGQIYRGNVFSGANSTTGGAADVRNNVESVFLPPGVTGPVAIRVDAANIAAQADPTIAGNNQDFALAVFNAEPTTAPVVISENQATLPAGNAVQPNSCNLAQAAIRNAGNVAATNVTSGLSSPTAGVSTAGASLAINSLPANTTIFRAGPQFGFSVAPSVACGSTIDIDLVSTATGSAPSTLRRSYLVGIPIFPLQQNFDGVSAPALPAGWATAQTGATPPPVFATTTTTPDSAPNAVFTNGVATPASNSLITPAIALAAGPSGAIVSFRHRFNFESSFDGGVLELSTDGGTTYTNVVSAPINGVFLEGGYTGPISAAFGTTNPIVGQPAWSGELTSYQTTRIQLPPALNGQTIRLRFRAGWDDIVVRAGPNWLIDTVTVQAGLSCAPGPGVCTAADPMFSDGFEQ
jgi:subtilisin family serine protease